MQRQVLSKAPAQWPVPPAAAAADSNLVCGARLWRGLVSPGDTVPRRPRQGRQASVEDRRSEVCGHDLAQPSLHPGEHCEQYQQ